MLKTEALRLLGGSIPAAAEAVGVTYQAVDKWPATLPPRIADRVQAALWRLQHGMKTEAHSEPETKAAA